MTILRRDSKAIFISDPHAVEAPDDQRPPLLLLTTDAASSNARRMHSFADAESTADFIRFWFPPGAYSRISAFWALPAPPIDAEAETVVLIRHPSDPGLVYPFSFPTMELALEMVRSEIRRGLGIGNLAIYYAARVTFDAAPDDGLLVTPALSPQFERPAITPREATLGPWPFRAAPEEGFLSRAFNAVRLRRWTPRAAPFAGFGSPPGRF